MQQQFDNQIALFIRDETTGRTEPGHPLLGKGGIGGKLFLTVVVKTHAKL
jgi:hypothetical protein